MSRDENLQRLRSATSGRIAISQHALPYVFMAPIRLVEQDGRPTLLVTVDPTTANLASLQHVVVAIHTDGLDRDGGHWEVLVQGLSTITDPYHARDGCHEASVGADLIRGWRTLAAAAALSR